MVFFLPLVWCMQTLQGFLCAGLTRLETAWTASQGPPCSVKHRWSWERCTVLPGDSSWEALTAREMLTGLSLTFDSKFLG